MDQTMNYNLSSAIHSWIIALGFKKQLLARLYRRSRGSVDLFHNIQSMISNRQWTTTHSGSVKCSPCNLTNIALLSAEPKMETKTVHISQINIRSTANKIQIFHQCMMDDQTDVCLITETWLKPQDDLVVKQVPPQGYKYCLIHDTMDLLEEA